MAAPSRPTTSATSTGRTSTDRRATGRQVRRPGEAWGVVLALTLAQGLTGTLAWYGIPIYLEALTREGRFAASDVALGSAVYFLAMAAWSVPMAWITDRLRVGSVVLLGSVAFAGSQVLLGTAQHPSALVAAYVLLAFAACACGPVPLTTMVLRWFPLQPARPIAVVVSGQSIGGALLAPALAALVVQHGLSTVLPYGAGLHLLLVGLLVGGYLHRRDSPALRLATALPTTVAAPRSRTPRSRMLRSRRLRAGTLRSRTGPSAGRTDGRARPGLTRSRHTRVVVLLCVASFCSGLPFAGALTHVYVLASERGIPTAVAAVPVAAIVGLLVRTITTILGPRVGPGLLAATLQVGLIGALALLQAAHGSVALLAGAAFLGLATASAPVVFPMTVAERTGHSGYGHRVAIVTASFSVACAVGTLLVQLLRSSFSYQVAFIALLAPAVVATLAFVLVARTSNPPQEVT